MLLSEMIILKIYKILSKRLRKMLLKCISRLEGGYMYSKTIRVIYENMHKIKVGYGSYGGCFNLQNIPSGVEFGNYCSIAPNIKIFRANHPKEEFTLHPILYNPVAGYVNEDKLIRNKLVIGNDVWIGENVIILPSVMRINNGSIIGAGSVVTKNVESYNIVAGNPARIIGMRFSANKVEEIEASKWWELDKKELINKIPAFQRLVIKNE